MSKDNQMHLEGEDLENLVFHGIELSDEKELNLFIRSSEFICRKTQEYVDWSRRTKMRAEEQNPDPSKQDHMACPICEISYEFAQAESHHHPITLFNLLAGRFQEWVDTGVLDEKMPLDLVQEVMTKHLQNTVEHVVLCKHCHEKYHSGEINISNQLTEIIEYKREVEASRKSELEQGKRRQFLKEQDQKRGKLTSIRRDLFGGHEGSESIESDIEKLKKEMLELTDEAITF